MSHPHLEAMSRRRFLQAGAAALGLAAVPAGLFADDKKDEFGGFILGVQSYTFRKFKLEPALKKTKELGLHYAEFYNGKDQVPRDSSPDQIKAVLKLCKEYEITPIAYGVEHFSKSHDANKKVFEFAKALGVRSLTADPDPDSFDSLDKLVDEFKIPIAIHPHGPQGKKLHRWYSAEVIMKAVKDHHKLIGTCLDTGHLIRAAQLGEKLDPAQQVRVMGDRNFGMHLKDHDNKLGRDVPYGTPGGVLNVVEVLKALREVKFKGTISIEYEHNPDDPTADVKECVTAFKAAVTKLG
jgi:inosose dehydratase